MSEPVSAISVTDGASVFRIGLGLRCRLVDSELRAMEFLRESRTSCGQAPSHTLSPTDLLTSVRYQCCIIEGHLQSAKLAVPNFKVSPALRLLRKRASIFPFFLLTLVCGIAWSFDDVWPVRAAAPDSMGSDSFVLKFCVSGGFPKRLQRGCQRACLLKRAKRPFSALAEIDRVS
jgi:hypothetical protein